MILQSQDHGQGVSPPYSNTSPIAPFVLPSFHARECQIILTDGCYTVHAADFSFRDEGLAPRYVLADVYTQDSQC